MRVQFDPAGFLSLSHTHALGNAWLILAPLGLGCAVCNIQGHKPVANLVAAINAITRDHVPNGDNAGRILYVRLTVTVEPYGTWPMSYHCILVTVLRQSHTPISRSVTLTNTVDKYGPMAMAICAASNDP